MEELLPNLQTMILPKMKGKRNDRKRAWFGVRTDTCRVAVVYSSSLWVLILISASLFDLGLDRRGNLWLSPAAGGRRIKHLERRM